jgi:glycosyltransferase involved in cell wall biosynthesis
MNKLISIVLPTYNKCNYLQFTLPLLKEQIERNSEEVELIICNNASTDGTGSYLESFSSKSFFRYISYNDFVDVGVSIARSISNATGKYVLLWGDDDVPAPLLIDTLLYYVKKYPDVACFHYNRLAGLDCENNGIKKLHVFDSIYSGAESLYEDSSEFISKFYQGMGFLSADMFLLDAWNRGKNIDCSKHFGFEFLAPIFYGIKGEKCMYIDYPLCIQRNPNNRKWLSRSPKYRYIGIPNLLQDLEKMGIISEWKKIWNKTSNTTKRYLVIIPQITLDKKSYRSLINEMNGYQSSIWRKLYALFMLYCIPTSLYVFIRNLRYKK